MGLGRTNVDSVGCFSFPRFQSTEAAGLTLASSWWVRWCSPYWRCYYANTAAIIYVIDASDTQRLGTAKAELLAMLSEEELKESKLLVFANKQDLPGALDEGQVSEKLGLSELKDRQWSIHKCCATKGEGLEEGLDW